MTRAAAIFNGSYTITSPKGKHRTFDIRTIRKGNLKGKLVVALLTGPDNQSSFTGFGFIDDNGIRVWNKFAGDSAFAAYSQLLWSMATEGEQSRFYKSGFRIMSEGKCIRCNRKLTHPESLMTGIGPECANRMRG